MFGPFLPGGVIVDRFDERVGKGINVVRLDEPAVRLPGDGVDEGDGSTGAVVITGRPHDIASRNTCPKGSSTEGPTNTSAHERPSGSSSCPRQPLKKTPSTISSLATVYGCSPSHSPAIRPRSRAAPGS